MLMGWARQVERVDIPTLAIAVAFFIVGLVNLGFPAGFVFDERFYVPAAIKLANLSYVANREHPMLAKELLALWLSAFGVSPLTWRLLPLLLGTVSLYTAAMVLPSRASGRLFAALLALAFPLFVLSRLAMLEIFCFTFGVLAIWAFTNARHAMSGIFFGLAVACKWSAVPVLACFCVWYALRNPHKLAKGIVLLGIVPISVYFLTYVPALFVRQDPLTIGELLPLQHAMLARHEFTEPFSPQASHAWEWSVNRGVMWMEGAGSLRLLTGNPVLMLALIPAVAIGLWKRWPEALAYVILMLFWALSPKSNTYYFHYVIPSAFGLASLARLLVEYKTIAISLLVCASATFAFCYPALVGDPFPLHKKIWPVPTQAMGKLTAGEEKKIEQIQNCMYYPSNCRI